MLFNRLALFALTSIGALAAPFTPDEAVEAVKRDYPISSFFAAFAEPTPKAVEVVKRDYPISSFYAAFAEATPKAVPVAKRGAILDTVTTLQSSIQAPISSINEGNTAKTLTADDAQVYLNDILNSINIANGALSGNAVGIDAKKRNLAGIAEAVEMAKRQGTADDLNQVGAVLAEIIEDIVTAVEGLADDLKKLPLIGALIISIDSGLNTLLLGLQILLAGVIEVVQGLLAGSSGLLGSLGFGLLFGLLFP